MSAFNPEISARALIPKDLISQASALHFSLHIADDRVEAALSEASGGEFHWSGIFPLEYDYKSLKHAVQFVAERNWGEHVFRKCSVSFETSEICVVPRAFFEPQRAGELLAFQCDVAPAAADYIEFPELAAVLIFGLPDWTSEICKKFPNARLYPLSALAMRHAQSTTQIDEDVLGIYVSTSQMVLTVFRNNKLHLVNTYHVIGAEDVLYHASNAALRLGIDFENASLKVASTWRSESLVNLLRHYNRRTVHLFMNESSDHFSYLSMLHSICA